MTFGQKTRESRKAKEMTQAQLAAKIGVVQSYISDLEKDLLKSYPSPETVIAISEALQDDSILLHYIETNPVYQHILPKVFPDLNNIRRDPAIIFTRLADEAHEAHNAARIMAGLFTNVDPSKTPAFDATFRAKMEQIIDIKRAVEILEFELLASGVIAKQWLTDRYHDQQQKCIERGHHKPVEEGEAA